MPDAIAARYLSVFLPWCAALVLGHLILRTSASPLIVGSGLASPRLLARALGATGAAIAIIVLTDLVTGGDLFLTPRFPASPLLFGGIVLAIAGAAAANRVVSPLRRRR